MSAHYSGAWHIMWLVLGAGQWPVAPRAGSDPDQATLSLSPWHYEHNMQIAETGERLTPPDTRAGQGDAYLGQT